MAIEGLDAAVLIENSAFVPQVELPEVSDAEAEPTLDAALRQAKGKNAGEAPPDDTPNTARRAGGAEREGTMLDLWISDSMRSPQRHLDIGGPGAVGGLVDGSSLLQIDPDMSQDNVPILRHLSMKEKVLVAGGAGTTDEYWGDEEGEYDEEIVITGPDDYWNPFDDNPVDQPDNDSNPDGDWNGQGGPDDQPGSDPYIDRVSIDQSVPPEARERAEEVREKLAAQLREIGEKINALEDDRLYRYNGRDVYGAELKAEFAKIGFNITWGQDYGPMGRGANVNGIINANLDFLGWQLDGNHPWAAWGTNWLILHELAHLLGTVEQFEREMWQSYLDSLGSGEVPNRDDWQHTEWFRNVEALTDWFAYLLGLGLDQPTGPYPPSGYDPSLVGSGGDNPPGGPGPGENVPEN